jgi:hypothetical protein
MRQPPVNPFKEVVEEEIEEDVPTMLPELPKLKAMPKPSEPDIPKLEDVIKGNGHNPDADEQLQEKAAEEKQAAEEEKELERMREEAEEAKIPGSGYLFNVKKKHLPEATRLNEREIFTFGVGAVQDAVLDLKRTDSVFDIFASTIFRLKISAGGKGREENIAVRQVDAEEKANSARGSMNGI